MNNKRWFSESSQGSGHTNLPIIMALVRVSKRGAGDKREKHISNKNIKYVRVHRAHVADLHSTVGEFLRTA